MNTNDLLSRRGSNFTQFAGASLGIHGNTLGDNHTQEFEINTLTPFGNVHIISGIFNPHKLLFEPTEGDATSGVMRFSQDALDFQLSVDGGISFKNLGSFESISLQEAYLNSPNVIIDTAGGNMILVADSAKTRFAHTGGFSEIRMSGLIPLPITSFETGDLLFLLHSQVADNMGGFATPAQATAASLGLGTLGVNTGSGFINVSIGSGIGKYTNTGGSQPIATTGTTNLIFSADVFTDQNYAHLESSAAAGNAITIMSSGLYKCTYNVSWEPTSSASPATIKVDATLNAVAIAASATYTFSQDADHGKGTNSAIFLFEARPRDILRIRAQRQTNALDTIQFIENECWVIVEKIGPQRQ